MADKHEDSSKDLDESLRLRGDLVALVSQRVGSLCQGYREEAVARLLHKRRRKWQKRHKLEPQGHGVKSLH